MKGILRVAFAALLTPVVFIGLSQIGPLARWVGSDAAWTALAPLFLLFRTSGTEGEENVLLGVLLTASFILAAMVVWMASALIRRARP